MYVGWYNYSQPALGEDTYYTISDLLNTLSSTCSNSEKNIQYDISFSVSQQTILLIDSLFNLKDITKL